MKTFKKDVARVGTWHDPKTGKPVNFGPGEEFDLEALAANTNAWIAEGNVVWFPDGHSSDSLSDLGGWREFRVSDDGQTLEAIVDVEDEEAAEKVGTRVKRVSPWIDMAPVSSASGKTFGPTITHVAATPEPVITGQGNFIALSRQLPEEVGMDMDNGAAAPPPAAGLAAKLAALLGLGEDASEDAILEALAQKIAAPAAPPAMSAAEPTATALALSRRVETLEAENKRIRAESHDREIADAKSYMLSRGQIVMERDDEETARALFAAGQEKGARSFIALSRKRADDVAEARRGRIVLSRGDDADRARREADAKASEDRMLARMGVVDPAKTNGRAG